MNSGNFQQTGAVKRLIPAVLILLLAACGSNSTAVHSKAATTTAIAVPTTVVATTTSVAPTKNAPSGEKAISCDLKAISANYGEKVKAEACTATWAVGDTDRDTWNCPKEGCEQTRLYHLANDKWTVTAICYRDQPLTHYNRSCYIPNAGPATLAEIPPSDVACAIWSTNRALKWIEETGCEARKADIEAALSGKCDGYFDASSLPVERCDHGAAVSEMQKRLRTAGYTTQVDGYFGEAMAKAVYAFQGKNKILQSGIIDTATWKALEPNQSTLPGTDRNGDGLVTPDEFR